jgi:hypothetical protein
MCAISSAIQDLRKKAGLNPIDRIAVTLPAEFLTLFKSHNTEIAPIVGSIPTEE